MHRACCSPLRWMKHTASHHGVRASRHAVHALCAAADSDVLLAYMPARRLFCPLMAYGTTLVHRPRLPTCLPAPGQAAHNSPRRAICSPGELTDFDTEYDLAV